MTLCLVSTASGPQPVTLTNIGNAPANITSLSASGDFAQTNNCDGSVAVGASCMISITFAPSALGTRTGTVTIKDNTGDGPQVVFLTGIGTGPVTLSPTGLSFGTQLVSTASSPQSVILTNTGNAPVVIASVAASGDFAQTNTCGGSVAVGASCTIGVTFTPAASGTRGETITIKDNSSGSPQVVPLTGIGTEISLSPTSLTFPGQNVGTTGSQFVTLTNYGSASISLTSVRATGDFKAIKLCPSIRAHGSCRILVPFKPTQTGLRTGLLTITDSDPASPQTAQLAGIGTGP